MKLAIGCDEAAYSLKEAIMEHLQKKGIDFDDFGAAKGEVVLYPDVAFKVADAVSSGAYDRGILVCGTGIGMAICANKVPGGIRAARLPRPLFHRALQKEQRCTDHVYGGTCHRSRTGQVSGGSVAHL